jgi:hypothetical protein
VPELTAFSLPGLEDLSRCRRSFAASTGAKVSWQDHCDSGYLFNDQTARGEFAPAIRFVNLVTEGELAFPGPKQHHLAGVNPRW